MCCEETWRSYFTWGLEAVTSHWPNSIRALQVREADRRLQVSHADTNHTEYSYIALYEAHRVKSKYIRVIYRYLPSQPRAEELDDPAGFKEDVAKAIRHEFSSETRSIRWRRPTGTTRKTLVTDAPQRFPGYCAEPRSLDGFSKTTADTRQGHEVEWSKETFNFIFSWHR